MTDGPDRNALEDALGHRFDSDRILAEALRHSSVAEAGARSFERLEFLGDRVLGLAVADMLLARFPEESEGDVAKRFAVLVSRETLLDVAIDIGLDRHVAVASDLASGGIRRQRAILADACEAVIGALYLDGGLEVARRFVVAQWAERMEVVAPPRHAKTQLQEWALQGGKGLPVYRTLEREGPAHGPTFTVEVEVKGLPPVRAKGGSKRAAEQAAASLLLEHIDD